MTPWETLGVAGDVAVADLRRRYAALIREYRPETHPQDFARIREAYEVVLPLARRREAMVAEAATAEAATQEAAAPSSPQAAEQVVDEVPAEITVADETSVDARPTEPAAAPVEPDAREPDLAARFRHLHARAEAATGTRDEAFLPELRALLKSRASASLDDSQALEFALLRWFIETDQPPLTLLFESGRSFDWHLHPARLAGWLSPWALRQMEARLALSRDLVWSRHFSGNAWLRRLHSPARRIALVASRPATQAALAWAMRWQDEATKADAPALAASLNPHALRRLHGRALLSTDLLMGLLFAATALDLAGAVAAAAIGITLALALRFVPSWLPQTVVRLAAANRRIGLVLAAVLAVAGAGVAGAADRAGTDGWAVALLMIAPAALLGVLAIWHGLAWLERVVAEVWAWRESVDRLEFGGCLRGRTLPDAATPFGPRWTLLVRLKAVPAARRLALVEVATRERPARPQPFGRMKLGWGKPGKSRLIWIGLWVLFALARLAHEFSR